MTGDRTDPPAAVEALDDDPLGGTDPTWRNDATAAQHGTTDDATADADAWDDAAVDAERTIDADPAWLAELATEPPEPDDDDAERTIDADADLVEHVRAAARAARTGLAAPPPSRGEAPIEPSEPAEPFEPVEPVEPAEPAEPVATEPPTATGIDPALPPAPAGVITELAAPPAEVAGGLPPPTPDTPTWAAIAAAVARSPAPEASTPATTTPAPAPTAPAAPEAVPNAAPSEGAASPAGGRWQPPARLRPAEVRATAPLIADRTPRRRHLDWRWAVVGVVVAAVIGFLIAIAVSGDDAPDPAPGSTTVPGASTTVSTP